MSSRAPSYNSAMKLIKMYRYLKKPNTYNQLKSKLKVSGQTLDRYFDVLKSMKIKIVQHNNRYYRKGD